jgi:thiamine transporter
MEKTVNKTQRLAVSGILLALGTILSLLKIYELPYGGSVTLFSMVPVLLLGYMFGAKWGLLCGLVYGVLQGVLGVTVSSALAGMGVASAAAMLALDYLAAFAVLGLSGCFKGRVKNHVAAFALGCLVACVLRFLVHTLSGALLFGQYAEWYFSQEGFAMGAAILGRYSGLSLVVVYSLVYNGMYMLPETALSVFMGGILMSVKPVRKLCAQ